MLGAYMTIKPIRAKNDAAEVVSNCLDLGVKKIMLITDKREIEAMLVGSSPSKGFDPYGDLCREAKAKDIEVHAWFCLFIENKDHPTEIIRSHPEYLVVNRYGKSNLEQPTWSTVKEEYSTYWVCPSSLGYRAFLSDLMSEVIKKYDVDGIHLDYVRYPEEVKGRYYCYCPNCSKRFREEYGYELPANDVIKNRYYVSMLCENVSESVQHFSKLAKEQGKQISAYVFTDYVTAIEACYQDWPYFSRFLDTLVITTYEVEGEYAKRLVERARAVTDKNCSITTAVYSLPDVRRSEDGGRRWWKAKDKDVLATVKGCLKGGAEGIFLFTYDALFDPQLPSERRTFLIEGLKRILREDDKLY